MLLKAFALFCWLSQGAVAQVTVYGQIPLGHVTAAADTSTPTLPAYNNDILVPPPIPNPPPANRWTLELQGNGAAVPNLSIRIPTAFWGFSIEMSVITQVMGKNSTLINVPFLNLLSNIVARAGTVRLRMGGNTQEFARYAGDEIPGNFHQALSKEKVETGKVTETPAVLYTTDFFYMMANISSLVNVGWYVGIPFNTTTPFHLDIVEHAVAILGDRLLAIQAGNEPDLYPNHKMRPETYAPADYFGEFGDLVRALDEQALLPTKKFLLGPSVSNTGWVPEQVWETGYLEAYDDSLTAITVERYPTNNCFAQFGTGQEKFPQQEFPGYLSHDRVVDLVSDYIPSSQLAQQRGKPFHMFETNTASCGGFAGISNTMGAALWVLDYGMQMAHSNFSGALLHVGGQNVFYNPFTATPTNQSAFNEWTVGAVYYSAMIMAEAMGKNNNSQIIDMRGNGGEVRTPQYAIYENGVLSRVALFNYMTDPSGANDYTVALHMNGGATVPAQVHVKYLSSESVSFRDDMTWAGQTFGGRLEADGRLKGEVNITTVPCEVESNQCLITVPAPSFALVFFSETDLTAATPENVQTYATSVQTKTRHTATVDPALLATSNGHSGKDWDRYLGSTSVRGQSGALATTVTIGYVLASTLFVVKFLW